jgi:hypothetical protein
MGWIVKCTFKKFNIKMIFDCSLKVIDEKSRILTGSGSVGQRYVFGTQKESSLFPASNTRIKE